MNATLRSLAPSKHGQLVTSVNELGLSEEARVIPSALRERVRLAILELASEGAPISRRRVRDRARVKERVAGTLVRLYKGCHLPDPQESWADPPPPSPTPLDGVSPWKDSPAALAHFLSKGRWVHAAHLDLLSRKLREAALEPNRRLIVSMPVRHGKSWLTSMWNPVWFLEHFPDRNVILCGHGDNFARKWGRRVRNLIRRYEKDLRVRLAPDSTAAHDWRTTEDGGMLCAGVGGQIMGEGANLLIVDDYCKNARQARSRVERDNVWEWWDSSAMTRLEPDASVVVVATRWGQDDLIGRILKRDEEGDWEQIRLPALAEEDDALGRTPGEALWPERWSQEYLEKRREKQLPWVWAAIYQQRPSPSEGGLFKKDWIRYYQEPAGDVYVYSVGSNQRRVPREGLHRFAVVDLAASAKALADYTVVGIFGIDSENRILVLDWLRRRMEGPELVPAIREITERWGVSSIWIERIGYQLTLVQEARRQGLPVRELHPKGDKVARALPATAALEGERVFVPEAKGWVPALTEELLCFPRGEHDDQVDVLSYAVQVADRIGRFSRPVQVRIGTGVGSNRVGGPRRIARDSLGRPSRAGRRFLRPSP